MLPGRSPQDSDLVGLAWGEGLDFNSHYPPPGEVDDDASLGNTREWEGHNEHGKRKRQRAHSSSHKAGL